MAVGHVPWSPCFRRGRLACTCGTIRCMESCDRRGRPRRRRANHRSARLNLQYRARQGMMRAGGLFVQLWKPAPLEAIRRVVLIRPDHLGDVLLLTPALARLRAALPDLDVTLYVDPSSCPVAFNGPEGIAGRGARLPRHHARAEAASACAHMSISGSWRSISRRATTTPRSSCGPTIGGAAGRRAWRASRSSSASITRTRAPRSRRRCRYVPRMHAGRANLLLIEALIARATGQAAARAPRR